MLNPPDQVLTLADLDHWSFAGVALAVLGHPVRHSLSPAMHNAALTEMARADSRFAAWRYFKFDVPPAELPLALERLHASGFHGLNLTVPHKTMAFDRMAAVDPAARPAGAVNTLLRLERGWHGWNTDGYGLATAVREDLGFSLAGAPVILLGAGGAARGAAFECLVRACAGLWIGNRTRRRLDEFLQELRRYHFATPVCGFAPGAPPPDLPAGALVINATTLGLHPGDPAPFDLARLSRPAGVYDMIYNPPQTALLRQAERLGVPRASGLSMLVHQGARALEIWSRAEVPVVAMRQAARAALDSQELACQ